jgi:4'-phosphopantetheinyl transferase
MERETLCLCYAYPDDLRDPEIAGLAQSLLSDDERSTMAKFNLDSSRREYLAAHVLARRSLSQHAPQDPRAWRFRANRFGKPAVIPPCGLHFNLSRRADLVACLVADGSEVGVDVEAHAHAPEIVSIADTVFSGAELQQLDPICGEDKLDHALSLWTLKEAYIKARGMGLSLPLKAISFLLCTESGMRLEVQPSLMDDPKRWRFCLLNLKGHRVALMTEQQQPHLQVFEVRPQAPFLQAANCSQNWFPRAPEST